MKRILLISLMSWTVIQALGCDICGCGAGSYYIGILPEFSKKIVGIRYRQNSLHTHLGAGGSSSYLTSKEAYRTVELWGGWTISPKIRLMASLPLSFNQKISQESNSSQSGLGDATLQGFYRVLDSRKTIDSKLLVQSLWVGAGIKGPTGRYNQDQKENMTGSANIFQLGTGSTDFTVNAMYDLRLMDAGINTNASYKLNTRNADKYHYGNKLSANLQAYYKFNIKRKFTIAPNTGMSFERALKDSDAGYKMDVSGGSILLGSIGFECNTKSYAIGANLQTPLRQHLAHGFVKANNRGMIHFSIMF